LQLDFKQATEIIIRKFTNYRNSRKKNLAALDDRGYEVETMKAAAAALVDWQAYNKGRACFARRNHETICKRRNELLAANATTSLVGAFQMARKELWGEADHEVWEKKALEDANDIYA
jgi:hypothetical protein